MRNKKLFVFSNWLVLSLEVAEGIPLKVEKKTQYVYVREEWAIVGESGLEEQ